MNVAKIFLLPKRLQNFCSYRLLYQKYLAERLQNFGSCWLSLILLLSLISKNRKNIWPGDCSDFGSYWLS